MSGASDDERCSRFDHKKTDTFEEVSVELKDGARR
jgi:hypothetical protein